jgi:hypothetical protein
MICFGSHEQYSILRIRNCKVAYRPYPCLTAPCALPYVSLVATGVLEGTMEVLSERRSLHRRHLHILLQEQTQNLNLSYGIGDAYHGFEFVKQRCKVTELLITYRMVREF